MGEEHKDLLRQLVEAVQLAPRRKPFVCAEGRGGSVLLVHDGLGDAGYAAYPADIDTLAELGAIRVRGTRPPDSLEVTPQGYALYGEWQKDAANPAYNVVDIERRYIDSPAFQTRHPKAYEKWRRAAELLWTVDSPEHVTSIGHLCREAHQLIVTSLLADAALTPIERDTQKTKQRLREVLAARVLAIGSRP